MRADGDKSSFVPPTSIEQADEIIRKELLALLDHDNAKYPVDKKMNKEKKKGSKRSADTTCSFNRLAVQNEQCECHDHHHLYNGGDSFLRNHVLPLAMYERF